ncbi:MAG: RND transporter [Pseudooceanicola sp.]|nr:RND transporter [Pseudooceanicola sp.]
MFPPGHPEFADEPVILPNADPKVTADRLEAFRALGTGLPTLFEDDAMLIMASVNTAERPLPETLRALDTLISAKKSLAVTVTGPDVMGLAISEGLKGDLLRLNAIGAALVVIATLAFLGDVKLAVAAIVPALLGMVGTVGLAAWMGIPITVLNNVIPMLILVIGVANGLHLAVNLADAEGAMQDRVTSTLQTVGPASLLTAGTTAIAFGSILTSSNAQLVDFAWLGAAAMVLSVVFLLPGFAALALLLAPRPRQIGGVASGWATAIGTASARRPKVVVACAFVLLLASGAAFATTTAWFPLSRYLPDDSPLAAANDRISDKFTGVFTAWVELPPDAEWPDFTRVVEAVEAVTAEGAVGSELSLARWIGTESEAPPDALFNRFPATLVQRLHGSDTGVRRFAVSIPDPMQSDTTLAYFDRVEAAALRAGAARVIGMPAILRHGSVDLIGALSTGLVLASIGGAIIVALAFQSFRLMPLVLFVNLLPVLIVGSAPHLLNAGHMTPPLGLALTIAFGIAIDDTVHLLTRYRQSVRVGLPPGPALRHALKTAGGVMIMTTLLLSIGLAVTAFSAFEPVRLFGATLIISLIAALLTDLILLPALLATRRRENYFGEGNSSLRR